MVLVDQSRRDDDVRVVDGIDDLLSRNVMRCQSLRVDRDMKLAQLSAGHADRGDPGQTRELRPHNVGRDIAQARLVAFV